METIQYANQIRIEDYRDIICRFISTNKFTIAKNDPDVETRVMNHFGGSEELTEEYVRYLAIHGSSTAQHFYPHHKREIREAIGLFTAYLAAIDDHGSQFLSKIRHFGRSLVNESPQTPFLRGYKDLCEEFGHYYPPFSADRILVGTINFVSSTVLEHESHNFAHLSDAPNFPAYFRFLTGLSEAYTWFVFPGDSWSLARFDLFIQIAPDIMNYTDTVNDVLSFYKEYFHDKEKTNPVCIRAKAEDCDLRKVLDSMCTESEMYAARMKAVVSEDTELLQLVDSYLQGYIGFHLSQSRYRLSELSLPI